MGQAAWVSDDCGVCAAEFCTGEAYQFDWSREIVLLDGVTVTVKIDHVRLCHSPDVVRSRLPAHSILGGLHDRVCSMAGRRRMWQQSPADQPGPCR
jgi:hypothetical protein